MVLLLRTPARRLMWLLLLLFGLLAPLPAAAQESGVVGTVRDPSGAVVAGDRHCADQHPDRRESAGSTTDDSGRYTISSVKAAVYNLTAEETGFQKQVIEQVTLEVQLGPYRSTSCCRLVT